MNCAQARRVLDLTVGGTVPDTDVAVGAAERTLLDAHVSACAACADELAAIVETAGWVAGALAPEHPADRDAAFVEAVVSRLGPPAAEPRPRRLLMAFASMAAAAVFVVAVFSRPDGAAPRDVAAAYPLAPAPVANYSGPQFVDVTAAAGITAEDHTGQADAKDWMVEAVGHGAAVLDADGDGDLDLFVPDGNRLAGDARVSDTWRLFRNDGGMRFTDVTRDAGLLLDDFASCAVAGDVNGDGHTDLFVGCYGHNRLFLGGPGGRFTDVSEEAGIIGRQEEWSIASALGDVDGDGDLDLYVANYADMRLYLAGHPSARDCDWRKLDIACGPTNLEAQRDRLFLNRGDGRFVESGDGLPPFRRYSFQPLMLDFDDDGDIDCFVAADAHPNQLLLNDGTGNFTDQALSAGVASDGAGREQACMGVAPGDVDGDGRLDLLITNFSHEPFVLYRGTGSALGIPAFSDVTRAAGLHESTFLTLGWGVGLTDYDLDGDLDAVFANGHLYPEVASRAPETSYGQHLALFANDGGGRFQEVSGSAGKALTLPRVHRGLLVADFDDDGYSDLFATVLNGPAVLLHNQGGQGGRYLRLDLRRADGRTDAPGARVEVVVRGDDGERRLVRYVTLGSSFASSEDPRVLVGLGDREIVGVAVRWPNGLTEQFGSLEARATWKLVEGRGAGERTR